MQPRRAVRRIGWLLILMMPALLAGAVEAAVRLLQLTPSGGVPAEVPPWLDHNVLAKESRWIELLSSSRDLSNYYRAYRWDRYLFYRMQPGLDIPLTDVTAPPAVRERTRWVFHTNARGFNTPDTPYEKPPRTFRIVALGDSSTFGWGVDADRAYPRRLEAILRQRHPGLALEVVNLGVCGYSSLQGLILMRAEALRYDPDVVTLSYGSNDFSRVPEAFDVVYERNLGWSGAVRAALQHSRAYQIYAAWLTGGRLAAAEGGVSGAGEAAGVLNVGPDKSRQNLVEMASIARRRGIDPLFVANCVPGEMSDPIRAAAREEEAPLVDTQALLEASLKTLSSSGRFADELAYYRGLYPPAMFGTYPWLAVYLTDQCHPNVIGHRLIAEALVPLVEATPSFADSLATQHGDPRGTGAGLSRPDGRRASRRPD